MTDRIAKVEIVETQQESEIDDELLFTLFVDGKTVSWAKAIVYGNLSDIHTAFWRSVKAMVDCCLLLLRTMPRSIVQVL